MVIGHSSDFHIGSNRSISGYLDRQISAINFIYEELKKRSIYFLVVSADIFHRNPSKEEMEAFLDVILEKDRDFVTILMAGNHDVISSGNSSLRYLSILEKHKRLKNTYIVEEPRLIRREVDVLAMPFNLDYNMIKSVKSNNLVVMWHGEVKGCRYDNDVVIKNGETIKSFPNVYFALGHLHSFQKAGKNAYYSGSPIQHTFGEKLPKGFLIVDLEDKSVEFVNIPSKRLIEVSSPEEAENYPDDWVRIKSFRPVKEVPSNVIDVKLKPLEMKHVDITYGLKDALEKGGFAKFEIKYAINYIKGIMGDMTNARSEV